MTQENNNLSFLHPQTTEHMVNGQTAYFLPISVGLAFEFRDIGKPLAKALGTLFTKTDQDYGTLNRTISPSKDADDGMQEMIIDPITVPMAEFRHKQRSEAIEELIAALTADNNKKLLGKLLLTSLGNPPKPQREGSNEPVVLWEPDELIDALPAPVLVEMLIGVAKANKGVFGPLADRVGSLATLTLSTLEQKNKDAAKEPTPEPEPLTPG